MGPRVTGRRLAFVAAFATVTVVATGLIQPPAQADTGARVVGAISREGAALAAGGERISDLTRPRARTTDSEVTVATRSVPGAVIDASTRPAAKAVAVVAAPASSRLDMAALDAMPHATGDAQWSCLAKAIYFESRGEPLAGQIAVAEVVLNRVDSSAYPRTVCGVTGQGVGSGRGCQFSYMCDGHPDEMRSALARERSEKLAALMLAGQPRSVSDGATHFHTRAIRPSWAGQLTRTATIGHHIFYRSGTRVAQR